MYKAGCIRVTHPCAALRVLLPFPLDLHVLSLPLAFILSQDQTLRCIYKKFNIFRSVFFLSSQKSTKLVHLASFLFFLLLVLQNVNELLIKNQHPYFFFPNADHHACFISPVSSLLSYPTGRFPILRGGKGNNLFLSTKIFSKILKHFFGAFIFIFSVKKPKLKPHKHFSKTLNELRL